MCLASIIRKLFWNRLDLENSRETINELNARVQSLQLQAADDARIMREQQREIERLKAHQTEAVTDAVDHRIEKLMQEVASPVAQLISQAHMFEKESKPIQLKDVLIVSKRTIRALQNAGLQVRDTPGETVTANNDEHELASGKDTLKDRETVVVRIPGIAFKDKVIRRSVVVRFTDTGSEK